MTNPLFEKKPSDNEEQEVDLTSITDEAALKLMVGEAGKYKTPESLAKAALFKDAHIRQIERDNAALKAALNDQVSIQDLMKKLDTAPTIVQTNTQEKKMDETKELNIQEEIAKHVAAELSKRSGQSSKEQNINSVVNTLKTNWGPNFQTILEAKATQLGASKEQLLELASNHPTVFLNAVGATKKEGSNNISPTLSSVSTKTQGGQVKNAKYYSDMRKSDPRMFNSPTVQRERLAMAKELGDKFFQS